MTEEKILYSPNDGWGMTYLFRHGYMKVTDNLATIPGDWIARFYYLDSKGNKFLKNAAGRKAHIDLGISDIYSGDFMVSIRKEIENMDKMKDEFKTIYGMLEKIVHKSD